MTDIVLNDLIEKINAINSTQQFTVVKMCFDILKIKHSNIDPFGKAKEYSEKDYEIELIVQEAEKQLTEEQLQVFYSSLTPYYLSFVSNDEVKKQLFNNKINDNSVLDYNGHFYYYIPSMLKRINDSKYIETVIDKYEETMDEEQLLELLCYIKDNDYKIKYLKKYVEEPTDLIQLIYSFDNDELINKYIDKYKEQLDGFIKEHEYVTSLKNNEKKIEFLKKHPESNMKTKKVLNSINDEKYLEQLYDFVEEELKVCIIYKFKDENKKLSYLSKLNNTITPESNRNMKNELTKIIDGLSDENLLYVMENFKNIKCVGNKMFEYRTNEKMNLAILKAYPSKMAMIQTRKNKYINTDTIMDNIDLFLEYEYVQNKEKVKECLTKMYETNNDILCNIVWEILDDKYVNIFGIDKLNVIASFSEISNSILKMNDNQLIILNKCLNEYLKKYNTDEWNIICERMIATLNFQNVDNKDKFSIIDDFDKVNIDCLLYILLNGDEVNIQSVDDINNYYELLEKKCNEQIKSDNLFLKRDAIFMKVFGISDKASLLDGFRQMIKNGMQRIYNKYYKAIDLIEDQSIKKIFDFIKEVMECNDPIKLEQIYNNTNTINHIDTYRFEALIKKEYMKLYNKELLQVENLEKIGENMYDAGVDFSIISTSIGAYVANNPEDYKKDWNRPSLGSPHFCTNFIRNDMMGTAPVPHVMYGFSSMSEDSLVLAGPTDLSSTGQGLKSSADHGEMYLSPDEMINESYRSIYEFNEMDFKRIQDGKKKEPDYILVKKIDGIIENIEEAKKASKQWGNLPIVVIDVNKCLENEYRLLVEMITKYMEKPSIELLTKIKIKINNNRVTNKEFASDININKLEEMIKEELTEQKKKN